MRLPLLLSILLLPTLTLCDHGGPGNGQQGQGGDGPFGQGGGSPPQNPSSPSGQGQYDSYGDQNGESSSSSSGSSSEGDDQGFGAWQSHHGRQYNSPEETAYRFGVYQSNLQIVNTHNSQNNDFQLGMNRFGDLTLAEFSASMLGATPPTSVRRLRSTPRSLTGTSKSPTRTISVTQSFTKTPSITPSVTRTSSKSYSNSRTPTMSISITPSPSPSYVFGAAWDWTNVNGQSYMTPIKDQGQCGSCWSFSAAEAIESVNAINGQGLVTLSEQQLVDCSSAYGNAGCNGGWMDSAFDYVLNNGGLCLESEYPYTSGTTGATGATCQYSAATCPTTVTINGWTDVTANSDPALAEAIMQQPVSIAIYAANSAFQLYKSGVFTAACGSTIDHAVIAYGFDNDPVSGLPYYKIRNQWGTYWGENGYMRMVRDATLNGGAGQCGMLQYPSYPTQA